MCYNNPLDNDLNSLVVVTWIENDRKKWHLGYINKIIQGEERDIVGHLERVGKGNALWRFRRKEDICEVDT